MVPRIAAFLIILCVFTLPASAQDTSARAAADEYLSVTGTENVFAEFKSSLMDVLLQLEPFQSNETIHRKAEIVFDLETIRSAVIDRVASELTAMEIEPGIVDFKTEFGRKMVSMDYFLGAETTWDYLARNWDQVVEKYSIDPERNDAVIDIMNSDGMPETLLKISRKVASSVAVATMRSIPAEQRIPLDVIESKMDGGMHEVQSQFFEEMKVAYLYCYRSASTDDLRKYSVMLDRNRAVSRVFQNAFMEVISIQLDELMTEVYRQTEDNPLYCGSDCR